MKKLVINSNDESNIKKLYVDTLSKVLAGYFLLMFCFKTLDEVSYGWRLNRKIKIIFVCYFAILVVYNDILVPRIKIYKTALQFLPYGLSFGILLFKVLKEFTILRAAYPKLFQQILTIKGLDFDNSYYKNCQLIIVYSFFALVGFSLLLSTLFKRILCSLLSGFFIFAFALFINVAPTKSAVLELLVAVSLMTSISISEKSHILQKIYKANESKRLYFKDWTKLRLYAVAITFGIYFLGSLVLSSTATMLIEKREQLVSKEYDILEDIANVPDKFKNVPMIYHLKDTVLWREINESLSKYHTVSDEFDNTLSNVRPYYSNKVIMTVHSTIIPNGPVYLRKGTEDTYHNGRWKNEPNDPFDSYNAIVEENMYKTISAGIEAENSNFFSITYNEECNISQSYHPYASNLRNDDPIFLMNSYIYSSLNSDVVSVISNHSSIKNTSQKEGYYLEGVLCYDEDIMDQIIDDVDVYNTKTYCKMSDFNGKENELLEEVYDSENYKNALEYSNKDLNTAIDNGSNDKILLKNYKTNMYRYYMALAVQDSFRDYKYSTNLSDIGDKADPIERFLENKTGYCMHFASAAVMRLRALGVPCRYAYGYIATGAFYSIKDKYTMIVKDSDAHAWVEVYFNDLGWFPLEVTVGYNDFDIENTNNQAIEKPLNRPEGQVEAMQPPANTNNSSKEEKEASKPSTPQNKSEQKADKNLKNHSENKLEFSNGYRNLSLILIVIVFIIVVVIILLKRYITIENEKVSIEIKGNLYSRAIRHMNYNIYRKLKLEGHITKAHLTDEEYQSLLIKHYGAISELDWIRYMEIVKKAAFSKESISEEELRFIEKIYYNRNENKKGV